MTLTPARTALLAALAAAVCALVPAAARASTWTVDDDHKDCPNASFSSIQAAVNQAAPHDTVDICPGTYLESSTPTNNASNPTQAGSMNGLTIQKPLNIVGAGAGKVLIEPNPAAVAGSMSLAGTSPFLRDGGGNVVTITRQSLGNTDFTDNFVSISGVTIASPTVYAEAGLAFFNASGSVTASVIGPLASATASGGTLALRPYGWGLIATDSLLGSGTGTVMRNVTVSGTLVTGYQAGGLLFDDASGVDGAAANNTRSGIIQYGYVDQSRIVGAGPTATIPQTGIAFHSGERGTITNSEITGNYYTPNPRQSVGILLTDAQTAADPSNPSVPGFEALGDNLTGNGYGLFNADATNTTIPTGAPAVATDGTAADEDWWGCAAGPLAGAPSAAGGAGCQGISGPDSASNPSVKIAATPRSAPPAVLSVPAATIDAPPTAQIVDPLDGSSAPIGGELDPVVFATDDFGVKSASLQVNGAPLATDGAAPYEFSWTPTYAYVGSSVALTAIVTDSANQTTQTTIHVNVPLPPGYQAATISPASFSPGTVLVGLTSPPQVETITNTGQNPVVLGTPTVTGSGFAIVAPGAGGCTPTTTLAIGATCTITLQFAPTAEGPVSGTLTVPYSAPGAAAAPLVVALSGNGHIESSSASTTPSGTVNSTLALNISTVAPSFGAFAPGVAQDYLASLAVSVTTTAASSSLTVFDPSATATGHLVNGAFSLPSPLTAAATDAAVPTPTYAAVGSTASPLTLLAYPAPITADPVTVSFKQHIGATDALRTGAYTKTLVLSLSTLAP
jgi:hypothetical protein